jgi:hypothetical protein
MASCTGLKPAELRTQLQESSSADMRRRRAIVGVSFFGMVNMAMLSLLQTGVVKHLPDPPSDSFDSVSRATPPKQSHRTIAGPALHRMQAAGPGHEKEEPAPQRRCLVTFCSNR